MSTAAVALLIVAVLVGTAAQRSTGIGFNLVVAPAATLVLPSHSVVGTVVRVALVVDVLVILADRKAIDWHLVWHYGWPATLAVPLAWWVGRSIDPAIIIAVTTLGTLALAAFLARPSRWTRPSERGERISGNVAGFCSGFLGITAGITGPPLALHTSISSRPLASNRSTMALFFAGVETVAVALHPRAASIGLTAVLIAMTGIGMLAGGLLVGRVNEHRLRRAVLVIVALSAVAALVGVILG